MNPDVEAQIFGSSSAGGKKKPWYKTTTGIVILSLAGVGILALCIALPLCLINRPAGQETAALLARTDGMTLTIEGAGTAVANGVYHRQNVQNDAVRWQKDDGFYIVYCTDPRDGFDRHARHTYNDPDRQRVAPLRPLEWSEWRLYDPTDILLYFILDHEGFTSRHPSADDIQSAENTALLRLAPPVTGTAQWWATRPGFDADRAVDDADAIYITVPTLSGAEHAIRARPQDTVMEFKERVRAATGVPTDQLRLIQNGVNIDNHLLTLETYHAHNAQVNLVDGCRVHMIMRLGYNAAGRDGWSNRNDRRAGVVNGTAGAEPMPTHRLG